MSADLLKDLRDIHLPNEPGWWPLAPGWWLLMFTIIIAIAIAVLWIKQNKKISQGNTDFSLANYQTHFAEIQQHYQESKNDLLFIQQSSILLRKISIDSNPESSRLTGMAWLQRLDELFSTTTFSQEYKNILTESIYRKDIDIDAERFSQFIQSCLQQEIRDA